MCACARAIVVGGVYFFKLGLSLLTQRRRHDFPVLCKRPLDRMELQSLGPYFFTWFNSTSSSSAFHGPFLTPSSPFASISHYFSLKFLSGTFTSPCCFFFLFSFLFCSLKSFTGFFAFRSRTLYLSVYYSLTL